VANVRMSVGAQAAAVPSGLPGWVLGSILLLLAAGAAIALILAMFGLFAALHIAYGASIERVRPAAPLADHGAERPPKPVAERVILVPVPPPAVEVSHQEPAGDPETDSHSISASAEPNGESTATVARAYQTPSQPSPESAPSGNPPVLASDAQQSEAAPQGDSTARIDHAEAAPTPAPDSAAAPTPTPDSAAAPPPRAKPHHVKRHTVHRRARRVARRSQGYRPSQGYTYGNSFEPMFRSQ
jgi:hypothetical protein